MPVCNYVTHAQLCKTISQEVNHLFQPSTFSGSIDHPSTGSLAGPHKVWILAEKWSARPLRLGTEEAIGGRHEGLPGLHRRGFHDVTRTFGIVLTWERGVGLGGRWKGVDRMA